MQKYSEMSQELYFWSLKSIIDDLSIWLYRFKHRDHKMAANFWRDHLTNVII
jgi:hypothetical protein